MKKKLVVCLGFLSTVIWFIFYYAFWDFDSAGIDAHEIFRSFIEFCCYFFLFLIFDWRNETLRKYSILLTLLLGSVFYYFFTLAYAFYFDWWYISKYPDKFFSRYSLTFEYQIYARMSFIMVFLVIYFFFNWIINKINSYRHPRQLV